MTTTKRGDLILFALLALAVIYVLIPHCSGPKGGSRTARQINNAKQILHACAVYAADIGAGRYPNGRFDLKQGGYVEGEPLHSAEDCFQDLFDSGKLEFETLFYNNKNSLQCTLIPPNEDNSLEASENCWDYVAGLDSRSAGLPLIFEASDFGEGKTWSIEKSGHPWRDLVIVGYSDGSTAISEELNSERRLIKPDKKGTNNPIDLCAPTPKQNGWPEGARIAPATPIE